MRKRRDAEAGLLLALAVVVKPYAVIFLPWLATRRNRVALLGMAAGLAVLPCVTGGAVRVGRQPRGCFATGGRRCPRRPRRTWSIPDNVSLSAMFTRWLGPDSAAPILAAS